MKKRDRLEIIKDYLEFISKKNMACIPTRIMYGANLSSQMLQEYTDELLKKKLINLEEAGNKRKINITKKGYKFLEDYNLIRGFINSYDLD